jgi:hypothetical protein
MKKAGNWSATGICVIPGLTITKNAPAKRRDLTGCSNVPPDTRLPEGVGSVNEVIPIIGVIAGGTDRKAGRAFCLLFALAGCLSSVVVAYQHPMSDAPNKETFALVRSILRSGIVRYATYAKSAPLNEYEIHDAVAAASFLGDPELIASTQKLISHTPNFNVVPQQEYALLPIAQLVADINRMAERNELLAHCVRSDYRAALKLANCPRAIEDVAVTQACLGALSLALETSNHPDLEEFRKRAIHEVVIIEAFRRDESNLGRSVLSRLQQTGEVHAFLLSLGLLLRRPWVPYPYPDW